LHQRLSMADEKKNDDGKGMPATAPAQSTETKPADARLIPGGSYAAARRQVGMTAMDHYDTPYFVKADLPDLSETPGWHMVPKTDRR
jgi:hypothetical protein